MIFMKKTSYNFYAIVIAIRYYIIETTYQYTLILWIHLFTFHDHAHTRDSSAICQDKQIMHRKNIVTC